jgi:protein SCO1/2
MSPGQRSVPMLLLCLATACAPAPPVLSLGGDFALTDHDGRPFQLSSVRGKVVLIFFGYTFCPDVCPTTLSKLSAAADRLGADRDRVTALYITVDPKRDTPAVMREHLSMFGVRAVGLTGTDAEIAQVASRFGAAFEVEAADSEARYTVAHTTTLYVLDREGRTRLLLPYGATVDDVVAGIRRLL